MRRAHTDREYESQLEELRGRLLRMAGVVEQMIVDAVRAALHQDRELAALVPLEVQAAHDPARGPRLVDLDERRRQSQAQLGEGIDLDDLGEPAPVIAEQARPDDENLRDRGRLDGERHRYIIARPPSTPSTWPVM